VVATGHSSDEEGGIARVLQTKSETQAFYNKIAKVYDLLAEHSEQPMREIALQMLAPAPGEHLLEVGFGTGHVLARLAQAVGPTGHVWGIDISENMLAQARNLLERKGLADRVSLDRGDAEDLPYPSDFLDGIFMCFTLELFDTPEIPRVLAQCRRVLRPGGRLVVAAVSKQTSSERPSPGAPHAGEPLVLRAFEWTHRHFPNLLDCRPIYVCRALAAAGFIIEDTRIKSMWIPVEIVRAGKPYP
jgi:ubiquinone/menaquinone biosynthesis C-methylase UbiE